MQQNVTKVSKSILFVLAVVYEQCYNHMNNYQGYDFSIESLLPSCNKPFDFCSKSKRHINMN